jgi:hypothetical protein
LQALRREGLMDALEALLNGGPFNAALIRHAAPNSLRLLHAISLWLLGNEHLARRQNEAALANFTEAARTAPAGRIYQLSAVLALAALKRWAEVDAQLPALYADWREDVRFAAALAMIGIARGNLAAAEAHLREPAEVIATQRDAEVLRRLWSGQLNDALVADLQRLFPVNWRQYIESWLVCEQYFFALLWQQRYTDARLYAERMAARQQAAGLPTWLWRERAGDAAFYAQAYEDARRFYEASLSEQADNNSVLVKLSDVYFLFGDLTRERFYREKVYGTLGGN